jgi:hypothetical protein
VFKRVVAPYPPGAEVRLADGRRGVVVSAPQNKLDRPVVRVGWDARGAQVSPYELDTADDPELTLDCVPVHAEPGTPEPDPPPLPTRPEPAPGRGSGAAQAPSPRAGRSRALR